MPGDSIPAISLNNCSVVFGQVQALRNINLSVPVGEAVALLGPSGCGKTTLLRVISGAIPSDGSREVRGSAGIVYQDLKLLPWMTVMRNVTLARSARENGADAEREALDLLQLAAIRDKSHVYPYQLSGGQKQRVAIVRALFGGAQTLLLDEPFSALDFVARQRLLDMLLKLKASATVTLVIVTHDIQDALDLADRVVVLRDGMIAGEFSRATIEAHGGSRARSEILALYKGTTRPDGGDD